MPAEVFGPCSWDIGESESEKVARPLPQNLTVFFRKGRPEEPRSMPLEGIHLHSQKIHKYLKIIDLRKSAPFRRRPSRGHFRGAGGI